MIRKQILALVALVALAALPAAASAQGGGCWGGLNGWNNGFGYNYGYNSGVGYFSSPPYFSLYPPVYYSGQIVRRPYGSSPFAYPSWYERQTPVRDLVPFTFDRQAPVKANSPDPMVVMNPFVTGADTALAANEKNSPAKLDNPFVAVR